MGKMSLLSLRIAYDGFLSKPGFGLVFLCSGGLQVCDSLLQPGVFN